MTRAIVVGAGGQDGRILFERLAGEGTVVLGIERGAVRCTDSTVTAPVDIRIGDQVRSAVEVFAPDEVYYLAAHHHSSEQRPTGNVELFTESFAVHVFGLVHFLEALRSSAPLARLFYAASSHVFGSGTERPFDEETPLAPTTAYGISKSAGVQCCRSYRVTHGLFAVAGFLFNHESPLRGPQFLSQKIARGAVRSKEEGARLVLGDLDARIDWAHASDTVEAMVRMLRIDTPEDFVVATGELHSVREFVEVAYATVSLDWRDYVDVDADLVSKQGLPRSGDSRKLRRMTGWRPAVRFEEMVQGLVQAWRARARS